jgi:integrase/recombinase XerC
MEINSLLRLVPTEPSTRLATYFKMFMLHQEASHHTPKTLTHYRYTLNKFLRYLATRGVETPEDVEAKHIRAFLAYLQRKGYKDTTLHAHARAIKTFFNFLVNEEVLEVSPMRKVAMPKLEKKIHPPFTTEDIEALLEACQGEYKLRDKAIVLCLLDSGLRISEFAAMNVGDVDRDGVVKVHGKGMKSRYVRLGASARKALPSFAAVRKTRRGTLPPSQVQTHFRNLGLAARHGHIPPESHPGTR